MGFLFFKLGWTSDLVKVYVDYPYLGSVARVIGFTNSPNKVVLFVSVAIYFLIFMKPDIQKWIRTGLIVGLLWTAFFTFSKEVVILFLALANTWSLSQLRSKLISYFILTASILFIISFTFFYISMDGAPPGRTDMIDSEPITTVREVNVYPTSYYYLFQSSAIMIKENLLRGVGFGNYYRTIGKHQNRGLYPKRLYAYEAHDNYTGLIAQYGIGYLAILFGLIIYLRKLAAKITRPESGFITASLFFFLLFGFVYFSYHTRMMWLMIGLVQFYVLYQMKKKSKTDVASSA
jgi:hypothetical protein